jgi:hypothetical protein
MSSTDLRIAAENPRFSWSEVYLVIRQKQVFFADISPLPVLYSLVLIEAESRYRRSCPSTR